MKKLSVQLEHCYGIPKLNHEFDFSDYQTQLVYAPNGVMKSSFAKVFAAYQEQNELKISDRIYAKNKPKHAINVDGNPIDPESIFVIKPFQESFHSSNISNILLKEEHKIKYERIVSDLRKDKQIFISRILEYFRYTQKGEDDLNRSDMDVINHVANGESIEKIFVELFSNKEHNSELDFYEVALKLDTDIKGKKDTKDFSEIKYGVIFNDKTAGTKGFLSDSANRSLLRKYAERYKELIAGSKYFNLSFTHTSAEKMLSQLDKVHYFDTEDRKGNPAEENAFQLYNKTDDIRDPQEREELKSEIETLRKELVEDPSFSAHLVAIDKAIDKNSTKITKKFKEFILEDQFDLDFLDLLSKSDLTELKKELIYSYLSQSKESFDAFVNSTKSAYENIEDLVKQVRKDDTSLWHKTISEFNERFRVPFVVGVSDANKDKVLMEGLELESLEYWFCEECGADANRICTHDKEDMVEVSESDLVQKSEDSILSQGERRAFYLLNIIFEIKYRQENKIPTLFIIDDIADSFDYQNKYAIAEYLMEISKTEGFYSIILTHNFDFFRTLREKLEINKDPGPWLYIAEKVKDEIRLNPQDNLIIAPFKNWMGKLKMCRDDDGKYIYPVVLMMRNILDISGLNKDEKNFFLDLIHARGKHFNNITLNEVETSLTSLGLDVSLDATLKTRKYFEHLTEVAAAIVQQDSLLLEDKIIVALYLRSATEIYLRDKGLSGPLRVMLEGAESVLPEGDYMILRRVNIITPEHIHINSFMYEPLIDMDKGQILSLYEGVTKLINS